MVTLAPWVTTWSHWNSAATRVATAVPTVMKVAEPTPITWRNNDETVTSSTAPPIMMRMGRMLR